MHMLIYHQEMIQSTRWFLSKFIRNDAKSVIPSTQIWKSLGYFFKITQMPLLRGLISSFARAENWYGGHMLIYKFYSSHQDESNIYVTSKSVEVKNFITEGVDNALKRGSWMFEIVTRLFVWKVTPNTAKSILELILIWKKVGLEYLFKKTKVHPLPSLFRVFFSFWGLKFCFGA